MVDGHAIPGLRDVQEAYASRASDYIDLFGTAEKAPEADRALIAGWADGVEGPVLDAGSGPGHWSAFLQARGVDVEGVDAVPVFVEHATRSFPGIRFRQGDLRRLDLPPASLGGILAWFSLIHTEPDEVRGVLRAFASALRPGGGLLLGFFSGADLQRFDHRVVTAWAWPVPLLAEAVEAAGLVVTSSAEQAQPNGRVTASLVARRPA